jgi:hypothetical protein
VGKHEAAVLHDLRWRPVAPRAAAQGLPRADPLEVAQEADAGVDLGVRPLDDVLPLDDRVVAARAAQLLAALQLRHVILVVEGDVPHLRLPLFDPPLVASVHQARGVLHVGARPRVVEPRPILEGGHRDEDGRKGVALDARHARVGGGLPLVDVRVHVVARPAGAGEVRRHEEGPVEDDQESDDDRDGQHDRPVVPNRRFPPLPEFLRHRLVTSADSLARRATISSNSRGCSSLISCSDIRPCHHSSVPGNRSGLKWTL